MTWSRTAGLPALARHPGPLRSPAARPGRGVRDRCASRGGSTPGGRRGNACLSGLRQPFPGPCPDGRARPRSTRRSKGCGTVMRSAPFGLVAEPAACVSGWPRMCAQITHGQSDRLPGPRGRSRPITACLVEGAPLAEAVRRALDLAAGRRTRPASRCVAASRPLTNAPLRRSNGWRGVGGEEALAIAVHCALAERRSSQGAAAGRQPLGRQRLHGRDLRLTCSAPRTARRRAARRVAAAARRTRGRSRSSAFH
ncbi:ADP-ribosylglycohydrolase family protein [Nonomuraea dietziae]|uniref:ADP-ribosylglycohydrolase family protein n=1 Tax=Nonomuraea dietziae TaxID=65515 RepID=UPI003CD05DA5